MPDYLYLFFVKKTNNGATDWKGDAMGYCAMGNVDRTFCPNLLSTKQTFD
jgi:hypothetical protein